MRIALVINAASGSVSAVLTPAMIRDKLAAAGHEMVGEPDATAALPERLEAAASLPGIEAVVVAGGDGTVACAASAMAGHETPLGLLPLGTMNLLAKDLGVPLDLDAAIGNLADGAPKKIDVGEVNGQMFLIASLLGMAARMARHREAYRGRFAWRGVMRWSAGLLRHFGRYPRLTVTGTIDGAARQLRFVMLAIVVDDFVERPGEILVRAPVDGGRLTLYVLARLSIWRTARLALGFALGDWRRLPGIERHEVTDLTIASPRRALRVMNDGEVRLIAGPLRYRIRPRALAVIVPRESAQPS